MSVKLSSLYVTAHMNVSQYVQALQQKDQADSKAVDSTKRVGQALAALDASSKDATSGLTKLSRTWIEGYSEAQKFEREIRSIETLMAKGMGADRAALMLDGLYRKFGQVLSVEEAHRRNLASMAPVVAALKQEYDATAASADRAARAQERAIDIRKRVEFAGAFQSSLNERLGVSYVPNRLARDSAATFQRMLAAEEAKQFAEMKRLADVKTAADEKAALAEKERMAARAQQLSVSHLPNEAEERRTLQVRKEIAELTKQGLFSETQKAELLRVEQIRHEKSKESIAGMHTQMNKYTSGVGFARHEVVNLSRQLQDIVVSLQGGQAPMTVLLQQGTQIADIFGTSSASFGAFLRQSAGWAARFAVSAAGIATALVTGGAAAAYFGHSFAEGQREIERSVTGLGVASGLTVRRINEIAAAEAGAAKVSVSSARDILSAFAATGGIRPESSSGLIGLTKNYAAQTGQDVDKAASELAKAFADPLRGADMLNEKLGFLDARTRAYIRSLVEQNDRAGAQRALMEAMSGSVAGAAERVGYLSRAWDAVKNSVSGVADAIGKAVAGEATLEERLANAIQRKSGIESGLGGGTAKGRGQVDRLRTEIENIQREIYGSGQAYASRAEAARMREQSPRVQRIVDEAVPFETQARKLKAELSDLRNFMERPGADRYSEDMKRAAQALEALNHAADTLLSPLEKIRRETDAAVKGIMARTLEERSSAELARLQITLSGQKVDAVTREAESLRLLKTMQAEANKEARDALRAANDNLALAGLNPYERAMREIDIRARENRVRFGGSTGAGGLDAGFADQLKRLMEAVPGVSIRSGYRSIEEQAKLYAEKGPGWAAPPGKSQHNFGLAADLQFATPAAKAMAHEIAASLGLHFPLANRTRNPEPWHVEPIGGRARAGMTGGGAVDEIAMKERAAWLKDQFSPMVRAANDDIRNQTEQLSLQEAAVTKSAYAIGKAAAEQRLINELNQKHIPITAEMRAEIEKLADGYGKLAENQAASRLRMDVAFEREQLGRTSGDQAIAGRLRGTGIGMDSAIADQMRFNQQLEVTKSLGGDALRGLKSDVEAGKHGIDLLTSSLKRFADKLYDLAVDSLLSNALGVVTKGATAPGSGNSNPLGFLGTIVSSLFGGSGGAGAPLNISPVKFHGGGTVGAGGTPMSLPGVSLYGVPKFHTGLMHDELLAVLQHGENVLTGRDSARTASTIAGLSAGAGSPQIIINNNAPVDVQAKQSTGPNGPRIEVMIDQRIAAALQPGGAGYRVMKRQA